MLFYNYIKVWNFTPPPDVSPVTPLLPPPPLVYPVYAPITSPQDVYCITCNKKFNYIHLSIQLFSQVKEIKFKQRHLCAWTTTSLSNIQENMTAN